ncbi:MAG TPA: rod shape-determining protein MreD [Terriglobia bacterium]|jgi:rod shape-determining protein MreD|nr:rod shape-determining protein MreD [Terriglobia bacterium]
MSRFRKIGSVGSSLLVPFAVVVIQGILAYRFRVFNYFDLPLIYCVYYGFTRSKPVASAFLGGGLGLLQDSLSRHAMGTNGFSKALLCFAAASTSLKFNVDQAITRIFALFLFTVADRLLVSILGLAMGTGQGEIFSGGLMDLILSGVFNTLLGLIMFGFRDRFRHAP